MYVISYLFPVLSRHIGHLVGATLVFTPRSFSSAILGKDTEAFPLTPSGSEMAAKIVARGVILLPLLLQNLRVKHVAV